MKEQTVIRTEQELAAYLPNLYSEVAVIAYDLLEHLHAIPAYTNETPTSSTAFQVALVGRFKTGKSMLINAMLCKDVMPYNTDECTAHIVTVKHYWDQHYCREVRRNGKVKYTLITEAEFRNKMDLTRGQVVTTLERFLVKIPMLSLHNLSLTDTPGFDGVEQGARQRAQEAISAVTSEANLCLFVLTKGIGIEDLELIQQIATRGTNICIVFNMSDNYDSEDIADIRQDALIQLRQAIGRQVTWFTVSAKWQIATSVLREDIQKRRAHNFDEPKPIHEWEELLAYLQRISVFETKWRSQMTQLLKIEEVYAIVQELGQRYDVRVQAEHVFTRHCSSLNDRMPPPLGPDILEMAMDAAKHGHPIPWRLLGNFKITPNDLAPNLRLLEHIGGNLIDAYARLCIELSRFCEKSRNRDCLNSVVQKWKQFLLNIPVPEQVNHDVQAYIDWALWSLDCSIASFEYEISHKILLEHWRHCPDHLLTETQIVVDRLKSALSNGARGILHADEL